MSDVVPLIHQKDLIINSLKTFEKKAAGRLDQKSIYKQDIIINFYI